MSDGFATGFGGAAPPLAAARSEDEKTTRAQAERWASLLGAQLTAVTAQVIPSVPASDWHSGDEDLTPAAAARLTAPGAELGPLSASDSLAKSEDSRLIIQVDGGDLGQVSLLVDRKEGASRVTIGAADASAEAALGLERAGLMRALQSQGIAVNSVSVVRSNNFGTVLAPLGSKITQRTPEATPAESKDAEHARRRLARKLNLVGCIPK